MAEEGSDQDHKLEKLLEAGSEVVGGATGAVIGFLLGGPVGAVVGGASPGIISRVLRRVGGDVSRRYMSPREEMRIGATLAFAADRIRNDLQRGKALRSDGFFEGTSTDRAAAEEIVEAVLLAAQRDPEERKLRAYSTLLANIAFDPEIHRLYANHLIRAGRRMSYQQLCLIVLFANREQYELRTINYHDMRGMSRTLLALLTQTFDLINQNVLDSYRAVLKAVDIAPAEVGVVGLGTDLYQLMELWAGSSVYMRDVEEFANVLAPNPRGHYVSL